MGAWDCVGVGSLGTEREVKVRWGFSILVGRGKYSGLGKDGEFGRHYWKAWSGLWQAEGLRIRGWGPHFLELVCVPAAAHE